MLAVEDLTIRYGAETAVHELSFDIARGESVGLVGESGSGKTQTALAVLGLLPAAARVSGSARLDDTELVGADEGVLDGIRGRRVSMVFQDPAQALNPFVRLGPQLRQILRRHGIADGGEARARVIGMLERVGLPDAARHYRSYPHELSGGMRQRAMIASALIANPDLLIADEPTTALDVTVQAQILDLLEALREDTALLLITHDLGIVAGHCERLLVLNNGALVEAGRTLEVFTSPRHPHSRALLQAAPSIEDTRPPETDAGECVFEIEAAHVSYATRDGRLQAVRGVDLAVHAGETLAVVGESGSGKSSIVRAALGLVPMESGRVVYCGETLEGPAQARGMVARRGLQLVFQDPVGSLNPQMRVADVVAEPLYVHERGIRPTAARERVTKMLAKTGLDETFLDRYPHELSGGQAQRVAIARALILEPHVLVCDEAVAALDGTVREQILTLLAQLQQSTGLAIVFITHDLAVVRVISHRVLVMYLGRLVELADNAALFEKPRHPYTRALLDSVPIPDPTRAGGEITVRGEAPSALNPPAGCAFHPRCAWAQAVCKRDKPAVRELDGTKVGCHLASELELARR